MRWMAGVLATMVSLGAAAQWEMQESHTTASLRGIHSVGNGVAWASGSGGTVLRTVDGGKNWQVCAVPDAEKDGAKLDFRGVQGFDEKTAVVMASGKGELSRLYKTVDACETWGLLFMDPDKDGFWDAISLSRRADGEISGWLLGDPVSGQFTVYALTDRTSVGGSREQLGTIAWEAQQRDFHAERDESLSLAANASVAGGFAASNTSLFELRKGYPIYPWPLPPDPKDRIAGMHWASKIFFVSGGLSGARMYERLPIATGDVIHSTWWSSEPVDLGSMSRGSGGFSIFFLTSDIGVAVGGDYEHPDVASHCAVYYDRSLEYSSWRVAEQQPGGYRSSVDFGSNAHVFIAVGPNGTDVSWDRGRTWQPLKPGPDDAADADKNWNGLSLPFVVGAKGRIGVLREGALKRR